MQYLLSGACKIVGVLYSAAVGISDHTTLHELRTVVGDYYVKHHTIWDTFPSPSFQSEVPHYMGYLPLSFFAE